MPSPLDRWRECEGLDQLLGLARSLVFLHDDSQPHLVDPEDVLSYHALLFGVGSVIVPDATVLSGSYGAYFRRFVPKLAPVIEAKAPSCSALRNCIVDGLPKRHVDQIARGCRYTSVFHSDRPDIRSTVRSLPPIFELESNDAKGLQDRLTARAWLTRARIPTPPGRQVSSFRELRGFANQHFLPIAIRTRSKTHQITAPTDVDRFDHEWPGNVWVEEWLPSIMSPNAQVVVVHGKCHPLFVSRQLLHGTEHFGNVIGDVPVEIAARCLDLTTKFVASLSDYAGVIGIDFIVTPDGDVVAVDVNARFNSSTIPFWWFLQADQTQDASVCRFARFSWRGTPAELGNAVTTKWKSPRRFVFSPITTSPDHAIVGLHHLEWR